MDQMEPIFGKDGAVVGWIFPPDGITDTEGNYRAFMIDGAVFDYHAHFLGRLHDGYFWDRDGKAVASIIGASNGPALRLHGTIPRPPDAGPEPPRPSKVPGVPVNPVYTKKWSETQWDEFLSGRQKFIAYRR
jgi:hypothetical protein